MRYRKGSKVEVLSEKEIPSGSWRCGEIVCRNGYDYTVRFAGNDATMERVSGKVIRPYPPRSEFSEIWLPGDVMEVLYDFSWRMATISTVISQDYFVVRLLGSCMELKVSKFEIRTRQSWEDNKWVVIGKRFGKHVQMTRARIDLPEKDNFFLMDNVKFQPKNTAICRTLRRRRGYLQDETIDGTAKRFRETENNGTVCRRIAADESPLIEHINGVAFSRERMTEESLYSSFQNRIGFLEMQAERRSIGDIGCSFAIDLEADAAESISCSVGSCSITNNSPRKLYYHADLNEDIDCYSSDAESFCQREYEEGEGAFITKEDLGTEIHRLELHAYRSTIEALHASGPLSWDQEALMTDLRLSLHISNDEHLMEVRNLVSASNSIRCR